MRYFHFSARSTTFVFLMLCLFVIDEYSALLRVVIVKDDVLPNDCYEIKLTALNS